MTTIIASIISALVAVGIAITGARRSRRQDESNRARIAEQQAHAERLQREQQTHSERLLAEQQAHTERVVEKITHAFLGAEAARQKRDAYSRALDAASGFAGDPGDTTRAKAFLVAATSAETLASDAVKRALRGVRFHAEQVLAAHESRGVGGTYVPSPSFLGTARASLPGPLRALKDAIEEDSLQADLPRPPPPAPPPPPSG